MENFIVMVAKNTVRPARKSVTTTDPTPPLIMSKLSFLSVSILIASLASSLVKPSLVHI